MWAWHGKRLVAVHPFVQYEEMRLREGEAFTMLFDADCKHKRRYLRFATLRVLRTLLKE
jgi:hypothetical protein